MAVDEHRTSVPRLRLHAPLGRGGSGSVWAAITPAGDRVAVRSLPEVDEATLARRRRRITELMAIEDTGLTRVLPESDASMLVCELIDGPALSTVRTGRGGLPVAEVMTLGYGLARALTVLHERGLVHGDVAPSNVIIDLSDHDGGPHPVLVDLLADPGLEAGTAGFVAPEVAAGAVAGPASDVWSLAAVCLWCVRPEDRDHVAARLGTAAAHEPTSRPTAADLAARLAPAADTPLQVPPRSVLAGASVRAQAQHAPTVMRPTRRRRARHRQRRRWPPRVLTAATAALVVAGGGALTWSLVSEPAARSTASWQPLAQVLERLVHERDAALMGSDPQALAAVTAPGSAAREDDRALLSELEAAGTTVTGLQTAVTDVEVLDVDAEQVALAAVLEQGAHERTTAGTVETVPAQPGRCVLVDLTRHESQWRVAAVTGCG